MFASVLDGPEGADSIKGPSWADVEQAIRSLDGWDRTLVTLSSGSEIPFLMIGGGARGFVVGHSYDNETHRTLVNPGAGATPIELTCGQQTAEYPARWVVPLHKALAAAKHYLLTGEPDPSLDWEINPRAT